MNRRNFIKNSALALGGAGALTGFYTWQIEPFMPEFVKIKMPVKNLPNSLIGKTLMQISDVHVGKRFDPQYIIDSFNLARKLNPDFVAYTGDYLTTHKNEVLYDRIEEVFKHAVKGTLGTVGILGNHDYGVNWAEPKVADNISGILNKNGINVLRNSQKGFQNLNFIGFDDLWSPNFDGKKAMENYNPAQANIVLCHNPDACDMDIWNNYNGWILSGHTHGGQCKPPFLPPPMLPVWNRKYTAGIFELSNNRTLYINRALGHLWQVRFNVKPEITIFTLELAS